VKIKFSVKKCVFFLVGHKDSRAPALKDFRTVTGLVVSPPLGTGVTLEIFKVPGTIPCISDMLNISANSVLINFEAVLIQGIGFPIDDFLISRLSIISCTSFGSMPRNIKLFRNVLMM